MIRTILLSFASVWGVVSTACANEALVSARETITQADLKEHVSFLASDTLAGRRAGSDGGHAAAAYLADYFRSLGLPPEAEGYRQEFGESGFQNVIALWGDADSELAPIIVSAHYDHVGTGGRGALKANTGQIHNGADDNASGTALVLELAEACSQLPSPPRPVLFALWDGEEIGLVGSGHDAKSREERGELPALAIVCDMVGRATCDRVFIFGVDTIDGLEEVVEESIDATPTEQDSKPSPVYIRKHLPRSDHWPFYKRDVPYLFFHTGLHDDYHRPSDDADLVNYATAEAVARLAFDVLMVACDDKFDLALDEESKQLPKTNLPPKSECPEIAPDEELKPIPANTLPSENKATDEVNSRAD